MEYRMHTLIQLLSIPHWVSYWAIGWQLCGTKYCVEIEDIFHQMSLLKDSVGITMPGNRGNINSYIDVVWDVVTALTSSIDVVWDVVTALTSSIDRFDAAPSWLTEKYKAYNERQEEVLTNRLEEIRYDIDGIDTVRLIVGGDPIEKVSLCTPFIPWLTGPLWHSTSLPSSPYFLGDILPKCTSP
jgi:hypothetical protein